jgi:hypothetical protein
LTHFWAYCHLLFFPGDSHAVRTDWEVCITAVLSGNFCLVQFNHGNKGIDMLLPKQLF